AVQLAAVGTRDRPGVRLAVANQGVVASVAGKGNCGCVKRVVQRQGAGAVVVAVNGDVDVAGPGVNHGIDGDVVCGTEVQITATAIGDTRIHRDVVVGEQCQGETARTAYIADISDRYVPRLSGIKTTARLYSEIGGINSCIDRCPGYYGTGSQGHKWGRAGIHVRIGAVVDRDIGRVKKQGTDIAQWCPQIHETAEIKILLA